MALQKMKIKVRTTLLSCFEGEKIPGGVVIPRKEFAEKRSARIHMYGTVEGTNQEVDVLLTPGLNGAPEFKKLSDIITREGTFECMGEVVESATIGGELVEFATPRVMTELTSETGDAQFKFVPRPVAKWAAEYEGHITPAVDYGKDMEASKAFSARRKEQRRNRRGTVTGEKTGL